jgi:hypothetical protein
LSSGHVGGIIYTATLIFINPHTKVLMHNKRTSIERLPLKSVEPELEVHYVYDHYKWTEHRFTTSSQQCSMVRSIDIQKRLTKRITSKGLHIDKQLKFTCRLSTIFDRFAAGLARDGSEVLRMNVLGQYSSSQATPSRFSS